MVSSFANIFNSINFDPFHLQENIQIRNILVGDSGTGWWGGGGGRLNIILDIVKVKVLPGD